MAAHCRACRIDYRLITDINARPKVINMCEAEMFFSQEKRGYEKSAS